MTIFFSICLMFCWVTGLNAENIICRCSRDWSYGSALKLENSDSGGIKIQGQGVFMSQKVLRIDSHERYEVSASFRSNVPVIFYFGVVCLDKNRLPILPVHFNVVRGTDSVLAEDCLPTDKKLILENGRNWKCGKNFRIAFETDASGKFTDLPNRNLGKSFVESLSENADGQIIIQLGGPVGRYYTAGTSVREHQDAASYLYLASWQKAVSEWKTYGGNISGVVRQQLSKSHWRPGTEFVRLVVVFNSTFLSDAVLEMKDVRLQKISKKTEGKELLK